MRESVRAGRSWGCAAAARITSQKAPECIGTETEAFDAVLAKKIPKNLPKSKSKRNMNYPTGSARYDCTGPEWMELFRSRNDKKTSKRKLTREVKH